MAAESLAAAVAFTHEWFDRHSGWAAPDPDTLEEWLDDGVSRCPDECEVPPARPCPHGLASWWLVLVALDRPDRRRPLDPVQLVPHPARLDPARPDYVQVMEAHHRAMVAGEPAYLDPATGLLALTARALWERGECCQSGCRHCPWVTRP